MDTKHRVGFGSESHARVTRTGGNWEAGGFALILVGVFCLFADNQEAGFGFIGFGFMVFLVGRFK